MTDAVRKTLSDSDIRQYNMAFSSIFEFCNTSSFGNLISELMSTPEDLRHDFVEVVMLSEDRLAERGIKLPANLKIQRTQFYDERPTLFCVTHRVEIGPWKKLTVTFDNTGGPFRHVLKDAIDVDSNTVPFIA